METELTTLVTTASWAQGGGGGGAGGAGGAGGSAAGLIGNGPRHRRPSVAAVVVTEFVTRLVDFV